MSSGSPSRHPPAAAIGIRSRGPMVAGTPISAGVADAAAEWLTVLMSGEAGELDRQRWQQWRQQDPEHERAWQHIEAVTRRFKQVEPNAAYRTLTAYPRQPTARRQALKLLLWGGVVGGGGLLASRTRLCQALAADYRTATGERRSISLSDGSQVELNTASAIQIQFDQHARTIRLLAGEIMVTSAHALDPAHQDPRPLVVATGQGHIRSLGTRFTVRAYDRYTHVGVLQNAVAISPQQGSLPPSVLQAGQQVSFNQLTTEAVSPLNDLDDAWTRGQMVADNWTLADFLLELGRYRPGLLRCAAEVADLRLSGVFPLGDTDRILQTLPSVLPVQVRQWSRYWVTVEALA